MFTLKSWFRPVVVGVVAVVAAPFVFAGLLGFLVAAFAADRFRPLA
jgi:hypothetical protein